MLWLVPALPLLGAVINMLVGSRLPRGLVATIASGAVLGAFAVAVLAFLEYLGGLGAGGEEHYQLFLFDWIAWGSGSDQVLISEAGLLLDQLSGVMILIVTGVGFLIHVYSAGYMGHDPGFARFFTYLNLFTCSMLILVLGNNFLLMFVGWELVGLCSYLLIGFWFTRPSAASAGKKAFIVNRVGDWGMLVALFFIWTSFGTFRFFGEAGSAVTSGVLDDPARVLTDGAVALAIALLLFVGATGKSAQVPLYVWLPDAMEGPTPVSALIHAATMVTAGVYMIARANSLFLAAPESLVVVAVIGALTAIFAASIGLVQTDIKRVLAYSTVSQLGYMVLALGAGAFAAGIFHLMTHAFFKALLFLGAGSVIHALHDEQDMRRMGGLWKVIPVTFATFVAGWLSIIGIPGFAGFFSKDAILAATYARGYENPLYYGLYGVALLTVLLTAFYMSRLVFLTFFGPPRWQAVAAGMAPATAAVVPEHEPAAAGHGDHETPEGDSHAGHAGEGHGGERPHESPPSMLIPLLVLAVLSVVGGLVGIQYFMVDTFTGSHLAPGFPFQTFLMPALGEAATAYSEEAHHLDLFTEWVLTGASVVMAVLGLLIAAAMYLVRIPDPAALARTFRPIYALLLNKWYVDELYEALIAHPGARLASFLSAFDLGVVDGMVNGVARLARNTGGLFRNLQSGYVRGYAVTMLIGAFCVLAYWAFR
ncbi:MAG TPA: NADH-quinone oxidoreductase subunit L [Chloroflexota bacterium]|nr:NADH-quinone oxidoreductase subunit L [Chloroflexota bacterium]